MTEVPRSRGTSLRRHAIDVAIVLSTLGLFLVAGLGFPEHAPQLSELRGMTEIAGPTLYSLDTVVQDGGAGTVVATQPATVAVARNRRTTFGGWAVDSPGLRPADAVYVLLDAVPEASCRIGILRPDVAAAFKTDAYGTSGFSCAIEPRGILPGRHTIRLDIVVKGRHAFYTAKPKTVLVVL